ncbi:Hypothetical alternative hydroxymethylpyrimidine phosphate kinase ThiD [Helicobacter heilmannii]|nr:Hypothetical alternative hydroxymethylpyrimidine phosphate kinase ThiD [Helicobacter heilmannii]CRF50266.1 Hypothetical alternative hydroxymethylpyrimidine phosphate kinase ThiD [Helicobacter heilmannii]
MVEDILRYLYNHRDLALRLKQIRHQATEVFTQHNINFSWLCAERDSQSDVLKAHDTPPKDPSSLSMLQANFKRAQESARVLEECFKYLMPPNPQTPSFKTLRYSLYTLEKECMVFLRDLPKSGFSNVKWSHLERSRVILFLEDFMADECCHDHNEGGCCHDHEGHGDHHHHHHHHYYGGHHHHHHHHHGGDHHHHHHHGDEHQG